MRVRPSGPVAVGLAQGRTVVLVRVRVRERRGWLGWLTAKVFGRAK